VGCVIGKGYWKLNLTKIYFNWCLPYVSSTFLAKRWMNFDLSCWDMSVKNSMNSLMVSRLGFPKTENHIRFYFDVSQRLSRKAVSSISPTPSTCERR
jgi:hypothetical protein